MKDFSPEALIRRIEDLEDWLVVVEGRKDGIALKSLGLKNIISLDGKPLTEFAFHVSKSCVSRGSRGVKGVVILTDFDSEGRKLAARLSVLLTRYKVNVNTGLRKRFMQLGKARIEEFKEGVVYGEIGSDVDKIQYYRLPEGKRNCRKAGCDRGRLRADRRAARGRA